MSKLKFIKYLFIFVVVISTINGCSLTGNLIDWKGDSYWNAYVEWRKNKLNELKQYIGKSKDKIKSVFGEPLEVSYNLKVKGVTYAEEWLYRYEYGVPIVNSSIYRYTFYFNDDLLVSVEVD